MITEIDDGYCAVTFSFCALLAIACTAIACIFYDDWPVIFLMIHVFTCITIFRLVFRGDYFNPLIFYLMFSILYNSAVPFVLWLNRDEYTNLKHDISGILCATSIVTTLAIVFLYLGYRSNIGKRLSCKLPMYFKRRYFKNSKISILIISFIALSSLSLIYLIYLNGGILTYLTHLFNRSRLVQGKGMFYELIGLNKYALYIYCIFLFDRRKFGHWLVLFLLLLIVLVLTLFTGSRAEVITIAIFMAFIYNYKYRLVKFISLKNITIFFFIVLPFFKIAGEIRDTLNPSSSIEDILQGKKKSLVEHLLISLDSFQVAMALVDIVPSEYGHYYGKTYATAFLSPVPRALYPNKPSGASWDINYILGGAKYEHTTDLEVAQSASGISMLHELYLNFSIFGVMIGFFCYGTLYKAYYIYLMNNKTDNYSMFIGLLLNMLIVNLGGESFLFLIKSFIIIFVFIMVQIFSNKPATPRLIVT